MESNLTDTTAREWLRNYSALLPNTINNISTDQAIRLAAASMRHRWGL